MREHISDCKKKRVEKRPLYNAMNKYGSENFHIELIEDVDDDVACERESYWIKHFNTYAANGHGYNATYGGDGKQLYSYDAIFNLWNTTDMTIKDIARHMQCDQNTVSQAIKSYNVSGSEIKRRVALKRAHGKTAPKPVHQIDIATGAIIHTFRSLSEIDKCFTTSHRASRHVVEVCKGKRKTAHGFKWAWATNKEMES